MIAKLHGICLVLSIMTGCSTFLSQSDSCGALSLEEIHVIIEQYETDGAVPESYWDIEDYYMARSYCYAHPVPPFDITRANVMESAFLGILFMPISLPVDIIYIPIQHYRTEKIPEADITQALLDIRKARDLSGESCARYPATAGPGLGTIETYGYALPPTGESNGAGKETQKVSP